MLTGFICAGGSFGVVYKAIEKATGEIVAIKHVRYTTHAPQPTPTCLFNLPLSTDTDYATIAQVDLESSEEDISDIQAEIAVLSSCASPFVTQYKTAFLRGQKLWIVMEYLGGGSCQVLL